MDNAIQRVTEVTIATKVCFTTVVGTGAMILAFLDISVQSMFLYFVLLIMDLVSGVIASFVLYESVTFSRFYSGILTKILLLMIPIVVAILVKIQGDSLLWFITWVILVLAASEGISFVNNVQKARRKKPLPEFDGISLISTKLRELLERLFDTAGGKNQ